MKKYLFFILIYTLIFRQYQKDKQDMPGFKKQFQIGNPALQSNKNISKVKFAIFTVPGSDTVAAFMQPPKQRTIFFETRKYSN